MFMFMILINMIQLIAYFYMYMISYIEEWSVDVTE